MAMVVLVTIGYPLFLAASGPCLRRPRLQDAAEPTVSLIIAAYNEEAVIQSKLENTLALDYPREKIEIFVASDGSTDRTDELVYSYGNRGVILQRFARTGKTGMQNQMALRATGEILVFSDANALYQSDAIRKLVRNFADPGVAGVCGQLVYSVRGEGAGAAETLYWSYEKFMKRRESELSSVVGVNGSIYAIRRQDYVQIDDDMISDFVEPLALVRNHRRVVYEPEAISVEPASESYDVEFRRKVRILTRSIRGLLRMRSLMNPARYGVFSVQLVMHKLLRFLTPVFLAAGGLSLAGLALLGSYRVLLLFCLVSAALAVAIGRAGPAFLPRVIVRVANLVYYYLLTNYALLLAWGNVLRGHHMVLWSPERTKT
jgi:cellulose synthase/poly-beta-1,6-N-acetylglucosamine synthase-like glycosyltransferase